ncbi:MAG: hypothetical protein B6U72_06060 [Candidatus Altiarchaeales archaeon ex4484_2]|nr:MAG: hypothetical protein B6U72_06060 [Candidatus Altiarchaeales archaeon ex4484_2]
MAESAVNLPREALEGNVFAVSILLIAFYISIVVVNKLTEYIILFLRRVILLVIVTLAFYQFTLMFLNKLSVEGATADTLLFGGDGLLIGVVVVLIAVHAALSSFKKTPEENEEVDEEEPEEGEGRKNIRAGCRLTPRGRTRNWVLQSPTLSWQSSGSSPPRPSQPLTCRWGLDSSSCSC